MTLLQLDQLAFTHINASVNLAGWRLEAATALAKWVVYLVPIALVGLWLAGAGRGRTAAVKAALCAGAALLINQAIGLAWYRPRPFVIGLGHAFLAHAPDSSFPSDHVTALAAAGIALWSSRSRLACRLGIVLTAAAPVAGWARVFLGIHYPGDVVGAFATAVLAAAGFATAPGQRGCAWLTMQCERIYRRLLSKPIARGWIRA